jgi:uncharacterized phage protein gp47/JayE
MAENQFGVLPQGFTRKRYADIISAMRARAKSKYGDGVNLDSDKPLGKFLDIQAWFCAELWELAEQVYNCISIDTAEGLHLDTLIKYKGLKRYQEATASGVVRVFGDAGISVPSNFIVAKENGVQYFTTNANEISEEGYTDVTVTCSAAGTRGNAELNEIIVIVTPITGITHVSNSRLFLNGQDLETDEQLRDRYYLTVGGLSTVRSIESALAKVEGVLDQRVVENATQEEVDGIPPKAFASYIYSYENIDYEIARAILESKAAGIQAFGETTVNVLDQNGFTHAIGFTHTESVIINARASVVKNQYFPEQSEGIRQIKQKIIEYIGGIEKNGTRHRGLGIGASVNRSFIISQIWGVTGLVDVQIDIKLATDMDYSANVNALEVGLVQVPQCDAENIEVIIS